MSTMSLEELYEQVIKPLSAEERLKLIVMTAQELSPACATYRSAETQHYGNAWAWEGTAAGYQRVEVSQ